MTRVLITGGGGLIGSSLIRELREDNYYSIYAPTSKELDMELPIQVDEYFSRIKPDVVFNFAAKVGGIKANLADPVGYFHSNVEIALNTYKYAAKWGVKKIINTGAGCGYPLKAQEPLVESDLWNGLPQSESMPYSTAKKLLTILGDIYEKEFGIVSTTYIPSNVYGPRDNFNVEVGHVVPALIHKFFLAKKHGASEVKVLGDGSARRDFIYVDNLAQAMITGLNARHSDVVNVATGKEHSIKELVQLLSQLFQYEGDISWDTTGPSGSQSRLMNIEKVRSAMKTWHPFDLREGLSLTIDWFIKNYDLPEMRK